ncbi:MAG: prolyl oligopeptidase family serine peptidase [Planctomycetes bacterium]|nr:prolyl oligopeptidase family serine peptidase [Planctomycetota bacterium]
MTIPHRLATLAVALLLSAQGAAQFDPIPLDEVLENPSAYVPRIPDYTWIPGQTALLEVVRGAPGEEDQANVVTLPASDRRPLCSPKMLLAALANAGVQTRPSERLPQLTPLGGTRVRFVAAGAVWHWDAAKPDAPVRVLDLPRDASAVELAAADAAVAWVEDADLRVRDRSGATRRVTWDGIPADLVYGEAAHRSEFGITKGLFWDPTGRRLAFTREDFRPIAEYPFADYSTKPAEPLHGRYPMAGGPNSRVTVGVFDRQTANLVYLEHDPAADVYWTNITFAPDGTTVYVAIVDRGQDHYDLVEFDAATGARLRTVLSESDAEWVEPEHGPIFPPDGDGMLWLSSHGGFRQVWRIGADGSWRYPETELRMDVDEVLGFTPDGKHMWVMANGPDPRERHLFRVRLGEARPAMALMAGADKSVRMTPSVGWHECQLSPDGWLLDEWSQLHHPGLVQAVGPDNRRLFIHQAMHPLAQFARPNHRFIEVEADDGTTLYGHVMFPPKIDPLVRYPVLLYVYAGPKNQLVRNAWLGGANLWLYHMASIGYVVVRLDGRGTPARGIHFEQAVFRGLGEIEVIDQLAALDRVGREFQFADLEHVGVHGWSFGGYMTLRLMTLAPDRFQVGVAGAPVTDWSRYETGYTERYMDTPQENPEGYDASSVLPLAKHLQGHLLLVTGTDDKTVMTSNSMAFLQACIDAKVPIDFMAYPMQQHGLRGSARNHFYRKMTAYFLEHLPPPPIDTRAGVAGDH